MASQAAQETLLSPTPDPEAAPEATAESRVESESMESLAARGRVRADRGPRLVGERDVEKGRGLVWVVNERGDLKECVRRNLDINGA